VTCRKCNVCVRIYACPDYIIKLNICKHIHACVRQNNNLGENDDYVPATSDMIDEEDLALFETAIIGDGIEKDRKKLRPVR